MLKNKWIKVLIVFLVLLLLLNIYLIIQMFKVVEIREIEASITVSDKIGFDLNLTALTFGEILPGSNSLRIITFENNFGFPVEVYVYGKGDMENFIIPFKERVEKDEEKSLGISAFAPENTNFGEYQGKVILKIKRIG